MNVLEAWHTSKTSVLGAWHIAKPNSIRFWLAPNLMCRGLASDPAFLGLGNRCWVSLVPDPTCLGLSTLPSPYMGHAFSFELVQGGRVIRVFLGLLKKGLSIIIRILWA